MKFCFIPTLVGIWETAQSWLLILRFPHLLLKKWSFSFGSCVEEEEKIDEKPWKWGGFMKSCTKIYAKPIYFLWNMEQKLFQQDLWHWGLWAALQVGMGSEVGLGDSPVCPWWEFAVWVFPFYSKFVLTPFPGWAHQGCLIPKGTGSSAQIFCL